MSLRGGPHHPPLRLFSEGVVPIDVPPPAPASDYAAITMDPAPFSLDGPKTLDGQPLRRVAVDAWEVVVANPFDHTEPIRRTLDFRGEESYLCNEPEARRPPGYPERIEADE